MPAVDIYPVSDGEPLENSAVTEEASPAESAVLPVAPTGSQAGQGVFGAIRGGIAGMADLVSRFKNAMVEVEAMYKETWKGGRPDAHVAADVGILQSTTASILSESGELLAEGSLREDGEGRALLNLDAPTPLPAIAVVRTPQYETGRIAKIRWTGETTAILEFPA
ncbi:MAG TPA: hypothetical protein VK862_21580 [Afifellaceae bacterium]|nr:hypothetical protein [Afifellaceae bacterium]